MRTPFRIGTIGIVALLLVLAACSTPRVAQRAIPKPPAPGIYALTTGDRLVRLDGTPDWEVRTWGQRADLGPDTLLVIDDPSLAPLRASSRPPSLELRQVAWLRSEINSAGAVSPVAESNWIDTDAPALRVPLEFFWVSAYENTVVGRPLRPLSPGLYAVHLGDAEPDLRARMGVAWTTVDERGYAANKCIDRYLGAAPEYRPCTDQAIDIAFIPFRHLRVHQLQVERQTVDGEGRLVVSGEVLNAAAEPTQLPQLIARTLGSDGTILGQWLFPASKPVLAPGESARFRTDIRRPSPAIANIDVDLALPEDRWRRAETRR